MLIVCPVNATMFLVLMAACAVPPRPPPPAPPATIIEYEVHGEAPPGTAPIANNDRAPIEKDQPPHVKLKLGHYRNSQLQIGVTIDLLSAATDSVADIDPAKLRFDGDPRVWLLEGRHGGFGRIDYVRERDRTMLQISPNGRVTVWIPDPEDRPSTAVELYRDGDADPL